MATDNEYHAGGESTARPRAGADSINHTRPRPGQNTVAASPRHIGALLASTVLLHDLGKIGWKRLDMAALLLAFFGLFPATFDSQSWFANGEKDATKEAAEQNARFTIETFDMRESEICMASEMSHDPEAQKKICKWLEDQRANIRGQAERLLPIAIEPLRNSRREAERLTSELIKVAVWYNASTDAWLALKNKPQQFTFLTGMNNLVRSISAVFGPYSLAIALAIKLTQIRSEIAEEKKKAKKSNSGGG
jgi:hypothetical protein